MNVLPSNAAQSVTLPPPRSARSWAVAAAARLRAAGADAPRLIAEGLLQAVLGIDRARLYARWIEPLPPEAEARLEILLNRALRREPLAYLTGEKEFWGLAFEVDSSVLVPRPETEGLVEWALRLFPGGRLGAPLRFIDAGTGSGCLAVSLLREWPEARCIAVDRCAKALARARRNAERWQVAGRLACVRADWLTACSWGAADLIVANPPYLSRSELAAAEPELSWEPRLALDGGEDGLEAVRTVIAQAPRCLARGGWLLLEIGCTQGAAAQQCAAEASAKEIACERDLAGQVRFLRARW